MPTAVTLPTGLIQDTVLPVVSIREHWADEWQTVNYLYCNRLKWCANPQIPSAEFEWRYGVGMQPGGMTFQQIAPKDIREWWVRVEVPQYDDGGDPAASKYWYGIFTDRQDGIEGGKHGKSGQQILTAYGVEILFAREILDSCWMLDGQGNDPHHLRRALPFNEGCRRSPRGGFEKTKYKDRPGNRSPDDDGSGVYLFDNYPTTEEDERAAWTYREIAEYLLAYMAPGGPVEAPKLHFRVNAESKTYIPVWKAGEIQQQGRSVKDVLDEVMDRRRLVGYSVEFQLDGEEEWFELRPFNYLESTLVLGDGFDLPGNADQKTLDFDDNANVLGVHYRESETFGQVRAQGSRVVCCFTISDLDSNLVPHWTAAQQTAYNAGASGLDEYAAADVSEKEKLNRTARASEKLKKVFTTFGLERGWDGYAGDVSIFESLITAFPFTELSVSADPKKNAVWYVPGMRFTRLLPLKSECDYSSLAISYDQIPTSADPNASWGYIPMMVLYPVTEEKDPLERKYIDLARMGELNDLDAVAEGNGFPSSCSVHLEEDAPAFRLVMHGDYGQHGFAGEGVSTWKFTPLDYGDGHSEPAPSMTWENFVCTVAAEADYYVNSTYPAAVVGDPDAVKIKHIDASEFCDLHYVAPKTIVGLDKGKLTRTETGGFVKDDRKLLEMISRVAYEWYSVKRQALTLSIRGALKPVEIGDLIVQIGNEENGTVEAVRTVVTEIEIAFARGMGETHRTRVQTQWAEFDVMKTMA